MKIPGTDVEVHERMQACAEAGVEYIEAVAIKMGDTGDVFWLYWPCRHGHVMHMLAQTMPDWLKREPRHIQGFRTNRERFVDRVEALEIARSAGQTVTKQWQLYSECVW